MRWWPRSIRWQMLLGLVLLEALSIMLFVFILIRSQNQDAQNRVRQRLNFESTSLALNVEEAYRQGQPEWAKDAVRTAGGDPSVLHVKLTDPGGKVLYLSAGDPAQATLEPAERAELARLRGPEARIFRLGRDRWEAVKPVYVAYELVGHVWVENNALWDDGQVIDTLRAALIFGGIWIFASILLVLLVSRVISRPLAVLHRGTRALIALPEARSAFPLPVTVDNEFGELIVAFNSMVASIQEQRAGLSDTLSLLDSMLANAPIGLAFFDNRHRVVRINQIFAGLTGIPLSRHLGHTPTELLTPELAGKLEEGLRQVFASESAVREIELSGRSDDGTTPWAWLVSVYPVRTSNEQIRWCGMIVRDVSERARSEETLRRTEKLAATGRLAASIAHEINNPLEALTNLLFLLRNFSNLNDQAVQYVTMAEHEARRIAEIAQQTLRFYRQSTLPHRARLAEIINSVLDLYKGRLNTLSIAVAREYDSETSLFCFEGEIRQVIANLVGNAVDAIPPGGRLIIRARQARSLHDSAIRGVRLTVADTGSGMTAEVRARIFEPFFTTKDATGTGLGLWVSQEIIEKHRGTVKVRSRAAGSGGASGTVFALFIPDDETLSIPALVPQEDASGA